MQYGTYGLILAGIPAFAYLLRWLALLIFLAWICHAHGVRAMKDAAEPIRAFRGEGLAEKLSHLVEHVKRP